MASRRKLALTTVAVLVATFTAGTAAPDVSMLTRGARTLQAFDLASRPGVESYFRSIGIDPATVVYQLGEKNYAGPSCPGKGWTCTDSNGPVYQHSDDGENSYDCDPASGGSSSPDTCVIVQSTVTGDNDASCDLSTEANGAAQVCDITQENSMGDNKSKATQSMSIDDGLSQTGTQNIVINQTNALGDNEGSAEQTMSMEIRKGGPVQSQSGFQRASVEQYTTGSGDNAAEVDQEQELSESFDGKTAITQNQNSSGTFMGSARAQRGVIDQASDGGGTNDGNLDQTLDENQSAKAKKANITQTQGQASGGIQGIVHQSSTGESQAEVDQTEEQIQSSSTSATRTQKQVGPVRCCSDQFDDSDNEFEISQEATQKSGSGADQSQLVEGECHTSGNCEVDQKVKVQGTTTENSCSGQDCNIGIACEGTECGTFSGGLD